MNILLIGTGNVATVLGKKMYRAGHTIAGVYGRNAERTRALAAQFKTNAFTSVKELPNADICLLAVTDAALTTIIEQLPPQSGILVHTAGAVSKELLAGRCIHYGVFYPLQSIRKENDAISAIPFLVDGESEQTISRLSDLATSLGDTVAVAGDNNRIQYHLAAVIANNFSNFLWTLTEAHCKKNNTDFKLLLPLLDETVARLHRFSPAQVQTGPAFRHDQLTIQTHLELLQADPLLSSFYSTFSEAIETYDWPGKDLRDIG